MFPADLLDDGGPALAQSGHWWALYTLSRREKDLMRRLNAQQISFYCPTTEKKSRSPSGRMRTSHLPLFTGYVFAFGSHEDRVAAQATNCVARWMEVVDDKGLVADLRRIRLLIASGMPVTLESKLEPGDLVRIKSGSLMGLEGVVLRRDQKSRLVVSVDFLQKGASVEVEEMNLEPVL